ncbi:MAG: hypothetical protein K9L02_05150 [Acholeplasmataceae bacterium]|nr:hypothetical protein [Acholeplasmataceae bacterium]
MAFINNLLQFLNSEMKQPIPYQSFSQSWFHYLSFAFMIILAIFLSRNLRHATDNKVRKYLLIFSIILLSFEVYKQIIFHIKVDGDINGMHFHSNFVPLLCILLY